MDLRIFDSSIPQFLNLLDSVNDEFLNSLIP